MDLVTVWFVLLAVLWTGYLVLEGFDFGVGMLLPVLGRGGASRLVAGAPRTSATGGERDVRRRTLLTTIGPHWDGNEVWLITAAGATFAAFPHWYATMLSGMYLPFLALLIVLIVRNMGLEYRHKRHDRQWTAGWDRAIITGSVVAPFVVGLVLTNLVHGLPMTAHRAGATTYTEFSGSVLDLLAPVPLLGGVTLTALCLAHGSHFVALKTSGPIRRDARAVATRAGVPATVLTVGLLLALGLQRGTVASWVVGGIAVGALLLALAANAKGADRRAFVGTSAAIGSVAASYFIVLAPNAINGRGTSPALTLEAAASSPTTLTVMGWATLALAPVMLAYTVWTYWIFRRRLSVEHMPARAQ